MDFPQINPQLTQQPSWSSPHFVGSTAEIFRPGIPRPNEYQAGLLGLMNPQTMFLPFYHSPAISPMGARNAFHPLARQGGIPEPLATLGASVFQDMTFGAIERNLGLQSGTLSMVPWGGLTNPQTGESISIGQFYQGRMMARAATQVSNNLASRSLYFDPARMDSLGGGFASSIIGYGGRNRVLEPGDRGSGGARMVSNFLAPEITPMFESAAMMMAPTMDAGMDLSARMSLAGDAVLAMRSAMAIGAGDPRFGARGVRMDYRFTRGLGAESSMDAMGAAINLGLVDRRRFFDAVSRASDVDFNIGNVRGIMGEDLVNATRLGRSASNIFGEDGDMSVKILAMDQLVGGISEGLGAAEVAARGQKVANFAQAMNIDSKTIANYIEGMKKLVENAGIASGESSFRVAMGVTETMMGMSRQGVRVDAQQMIEGMVDFTHSSVGRSTRIREAGLRLAEAEGALTAGGRAALQALDSGNVSEYLRLMESGAADGMQRFMSRAAGLTDSQLSMLSFGFGENLVEFTAIQRGEAYREHLLDIMSRNTGVSRVLGDIVQSHDAGAVAGLLRLGEREFTRVIQSDGADSRFSDDFLKDVREAFGNMSQSDIRDIHRATATMHRITQDEVGDMGAAIAFSQTDREQLALQKSRATIESFIADSLGRAPTGAMDLIRGLLADEDFTEARESNPALGTKVENFIQRLQTDVGDGDITDLDAAARGEILAEFREIMSEAGRTMGDSSLQKAISRKLGIPGAAAFGALSEDEFWESSLHVWDPQEGRVGAYSGLDDFIRKFNSTESPEDRLEMKKDLLDELEAYTKEQGTGTIDLDKMMDELTETLKKLTQAPLAVRAQEAVVNHLEGISKSLKTLPERITNILTGSAPDSE